MAHFPFVTVLRISDVKVSRVDLESRLGAPIARYESARNGPFHYAQIDFAVADVDTPPAGNPWPTIVDWLDRLGPQIQALKSDGSIGPTSIDLAVSFAEKFHVVTYNLPHSVARAAGRNGIDINLSVYRGDVDEQT